MSVVFIGLSGGIGNQLFQLATAYSYAIQTGSTLRYYLRNDDHYGRRFYLKSLFQLLSVEEAAIESDYSYYKVLNDLTFYDEKWLFRRDLLSSVRLEGSFHQWRYFYKDLGRLRPKIQHWLTDYAGRYYPGQDMTSESLIHLRLAHNRSEGLFRVNGATSLPAFFVARMIRESANNHGYHLDLVLDMPIESNEVQSYLRQLGKLVPEVRLRAVGRADPLHDLYLMQVATRCFIMSNSTFSMWGSILNNKPATYGPYLGNLEKWATNMPHVHEFYLDTRLAKFKNHSDVSLEPLLRADSLILRLFMRVLSVSRLPFCRRVHARIEKLLARQYLW